MSFFNAYDEDTCPATSRYSKAYNSAGRCNNAAGESRRLPDSVHALIIPRQRLLPFTLRRYHICAFPHYGVLRASTYDASRDVYRRKNAIERQRYYRPSQEGLMREHVVRQCRHTVSSSRPGFAAESNPPATVAFRQSRWRVQSPLQSFITSLFE